MSKTFTKEEAHELLRNGRVARNAGKLEEALTWYEGYLSVSMEIYKSEPGDSVQKAFMLQDMQDNMSIAEELKKSIAIQREERREAEKRQKEEEERQRQAGGSVFTFFGRSKAKPGSVGEEAGGGGEAAGAAGPPNDFYDYTAQARKARAAQQQQASVNRLHSGAPANGAGQPCHRQQQHPRPHSMSRAPTSGGSSQASGQRPSNTRTGTGTGNGDTSAGGSSSRAIAKLPADPAAKKHTEYETQILEEMLDSSPGVTWADIAGLSFAKQTLQEAVILPNLRPDLFTGLRRPPKGVLLFGPPGTGKTMLAKAVASESGFSFFTISAASVTSKYLGEGEKLIKALFSVCREHQPSVIFMDEIDALMSARKDGEHEASRRLKTEFMTQVDGATTDSEDRILIMAATNLPWEIDEAVLRRLVKRIYIPLPDEEARHALISHLLNKQQQAQIAAKAASGGTATTTTSSNNNSSSSNGSGVEGVAGAIGSAAAPAETNLLSAREMSRLVKMTEGYSGSDLTAVCHEAALGPIRELPPTALRTIKAEDVRAVNFKDLSSALKVVRPSVSQDNIAAFRKWSDQYGASSR